MSESSKQNESQKTLEKESEVDEELDNLLESNYFFILLNSINLP